MHDKELSITRLLFSVARSNACYGGELGMAYYFLPQGAFFFQIFSFVTQENVMLTKHLIQSIFIFEKPAS